MTGLNSSKALPMVFLILVAAWASTACVSASEGRRMRQDIETLDARFVELSSSLASDRARLTELIQTAEIEIEQVQVALEEAQGLLRRTNTDLGGQVEGLGQEIQELRGQLEHSDFRLNQLQEQLNLLIEDIDIRFSTM